VIVDLVLIGLAMALYPVAITFFILIVASRGGLRKGAGFIFGWLAALAVVATVTISATRNTPPAGGTSPSAGILAAKIVLGLVLLGVAERQRRRVGHPRMKKEPAWRARLDDMSAVFAVGLGAFFQPSVLVVSAAATITGAKLSSVADYVSLVVFGLLSISTYLSMEIYVALRPEQSANVLTSLDTWIDRHTDLIIIVGATALGLWLIGKNAYLLAT
jgi:Sap, sulfolipid-1-addressing protein